MCEANERERILKMSSTKSKTEINHHKGLTSPLDGKVLFWILPLGLPQLCPQMLSIWYPAPLPPAWWSLRSSKSDFLEQLPRWALPSSPADTISRGSPGLLSNLEMSLKVFVWNTIRDILILKGFWDFLSLGKHPVLTFFLIWIGSVNWLSKSLGTPFRNLFLFLT